MLLNSYFSVHRLETLTYPAAGRVQDKPNGIYSCSLCTLFEKPKHCNLVEGDVSEDGWCKAFAMADWGLRTWGSLPLSYAVL
jgi:hypothetical protein